MLGGSFNGKHGSATPEYSIASQFTPDGWHKNLGGGAIADAILDRIVSSAYTIHIKRQINENAKKGLIKNVTMVKSIVTIFIITLV